MSEKSGVEARREEWFAAMRWRRRVEVALADVGLTFTQWLVLDVAHRMVARRHEAVIQRQIAARAELDLATVSLVLRTLENHHLISRGPDFSGKARRVLVTERAQHLLEAHRARIELASRAKPPENEEVRATFETHHPSQPRRSRLRVGINRW